MEGFMPFDPSCKANNELRDSLGIKNNYQYRQWLINNGNSVSRQNRKTACNECSQCWLKSSTSSTTTKYLFKNCADQSKPYGYEVQILKSLFYSTTCNHN